ncbi:ABC transporter ATP-binding protein [Mycoplasmopsis gallinacea]|uniref:ABC transporter ATP-binding protein n=1 Tax=Mycoplasmopsis gallinacea TaxID=29556 RepID=A0A0D5ZJ89_9BACT|nr:ABC transporter ATP-binding protein [Mycoplasmopsis gallinacea]
MIKVFKLLPKKVKTLFLIGIILILINVVITMFLPILLSQFLSLIAPSSNEASQVYYIVLFNKVNLFPSNTQAQAITKLIIIVILMIIFGLITSIGSVLITTYAGELSSNHLRNILFEKYQKLSIKDIAELKTETLITRINDDVAIFWDFLMSASSSLVRAPFFIIVGVVFSFLTDVNLSWAAIGVVPVLVFVLLLIFKLVNPLIKKNRKNLDQITKEVEESIIGSKLIKTYNLEQKQKHKFDLANKRWSSVEIKTFSYFAIGNPAFFAIINLVIVAIYYIAAYNLNDISGDKRQFFATINVFIEYEVLISFGILMLSQFLGILFRAKTSAGRIVEILEKPYDDLNVTNGLTLDKSLPTKDFSVEFKDFNFKYYKNSPEYILKNINFKVNGGKTLGIIGPTGSGKTTIGTLIANNLKYTEGSILINDKELNQINSKDLSESLSIVYQESQLFAGTIRSNLLFAKPDATAEEISKALTASCAIDFVYRFDDGLDHPVYQRGKNLSGGQKQRLSIARSLLVNPKILILDDSTSALDNLTTKKLIENIKKYYDCTTIIISQKINSIKHSDEILVINAGEIIAKGKHEQLTKECKWYREIYHNQLEQ